MENQIYHKRLNAHTSIGIDIDETLINGPNSRYLQRWVKHYHPTIQMHLVTFRTEDDFDRIEEDLTAAGIELDLFHGIHGIPLDVASEFYKLTAKVGIRGSVPEPKWQRTIRYHNVSEDHYESLSEMVKLWKGLKCKELGLTALVDDLEQMVVPGCVRYDIEWINALTLHKD